MAYFLWLALCLSTIGYVTQGFPFDIADTFTTSYFVQRFMRSRWQTVLQHFENRIARIIAEASSLEECQDDLIRTSENIKHRLFMETSSLNVGAYTFKPNIESDITKWTLDATAYVRLQAPTCMNQGIYEASSEYLEKLVKKILILPENTLLEHNNNNNNTSISLLTIKLQLTSANNDSTTAQLNYVSSSSSEIENNNFQVFEVVADNSTSALPGVIRFYPIEIQFFPTSCCVNSLRVSTLKFQGHCELLEIQHGTKLMCSKDDEICRVLADDICQGYLDMIAQVQLNKINTYIDDTFENHRLCQTITSSLLGLANKLQLKRPFRWPFAL